MVQKSAAFRLRFDRNEIPDGGDKLRLILPTKLKPEPKNRHDMEVSVH